MTLFWHGNVYRVLEVLNSIVSGANPIDIDRIATLIHNEHVRTLAKVGDTHKT